MGPGDEPRSGAIAAGARRTGALAIGFYNSGQLFVEDYYARQLQAAAPDAWVELAPGDAKRLGIAESDLVRVESPRGRIEVKARLTGIREGVVFAPFHYGGRRREGTRRGRWEED